MSSINLEYFNWLCDKIVQNNEQKSNEKLLKFLFNRDYIWVIPMDENRAGDGIWLRREFSSEKNYTKKPLSGEPCSVLEMLVALSIRIEDDVMYDWEMGDRTGDWFWIMVKNMGLLRSVLWDKCLENFHQRTYKNGGLGCPFRMKNMDEKEFEMFKKEELWNQFLDYLSENFEV